MAQPMRQAHWHLGFFPPEQKQYDCWHSTPLGEGTAASAPARAPSGQAQRCLMCLPEFTQGQDGAWEGESEEVGGDSPA